MRWMTYQLELKRSVGRLWSRAPPRGSVAHSPYTMVVQAHDPHSKPRSLSAMVIRLRGGLNSKRVILNLLGSTLADRRESHPSICTHS